MICLLVTDPETVTELIFGEPMVLVKIIVPVEPRIPPSLHLMLAVSASLGVFGVSSPPRKIVVVPIDWAASGSSAANEMSYSPLCPAIVCMFTCASVNLLRSSVPKSYPRVVSDAVMLGDTTEAELSTSARRQHRGTLTE